MIGLRIIPELEGALPELDDANVVTGRLSVIGALSEGMASGKPSVGMVIELPEGKMVFAETSLALLLSAADVLRARYGDPRHDDVPAGKV